METFESILIRCYVFAFKILKSKGKTHIYCRDIVHSAYLNLNGTFSFENMRQPIYDSIREYISSYFSQTSQLDGPIKTTLNDALRGEIECKCCKGCSQTLPVAFFHKSRSVGDRIMYQSRCKECQRILNKKNREKRLSDQEYYISYYAKQAKKQAEVRKIIKNNPSLHQHFKEQIKLYTRDYRAKKTKPQ